MSDRRGPDPLWCRRHGRVRGTVDSGEAVPPGNRTLGSVTAESDSAKLHIYHTAISELETGSSDSLTAAALWRATVQRAARSGTHTHTHMRAHTPLSLCPGGGCDSWRRTAGTVQTARRCNQVAGPPGALGVLGVSIRHVCDYCVLRCRAVGGLQLCYVCDTQATATLCALARAAGVPSGEGMCAACARPVLCGPCLQNGERGGRVGGRALAEKIEARGRSRRAPGAGRGERADVGHWFDECGWSAAAGR